MFRAKWWTLASLLAVLLILGAPIASAEEAEKKGSEAEKEGPDVDVEDIVEGLTEELELSEDQQKQVTVALQEFMMGLHKATESDEGEEGDGKSALTAFKAERSAFNGKMKDILTKEQWEKYQAKLNEVLTEMFNDLAEIKILDLKPVLDLTDEQVEELAPIMGAGMRDMLSIMIEYGDKTLRMPTKVKVGKKMKKIQSDMNSGMKKVLTEEQWATYEAHKEAQKEESSSD